MELFQVLSLFVLILVVSVGTYASEDSCYQISGPSGRYRCKLLKPYYNKYQWATCLTNDYIEMKSNFRHACRADIYMVRPKYCWAQCMMELHEIQEGMVYKDCECSPYDDIPTAPNNSIPGNCMSPNGNDCSWFSRCLKAKHSCNTKLYKEMIDLGSAFCKLNPNNSYPRLSTNTSLYVTAAKNCFQVQMAPVLKPWLNLTCSYIDKKAMTTRGKCLNHPLGVVSLDDIDSIELRKTFWTLIETFNLRNVISVFPFFEEINKRDDNFIETYKICRFVLNIEISDNEYDTFLDHVIPAANWDEHDTVWFGMKNLKDITIVFASREEIGLETYSNGLRTENLNASLITLAKSVERGQFHYLTNDYTKNIQVIEFYACKDWNCTEKYLYKNVTYKDIQPEHWNKEKDRKPQDDVKTVKPNHGMVSIGGFIGGGVCIILLLAAGVSMRMYWMARYRKDEPLVQNEQIHA